MLAPSAFRKEQLTFGDFENTHLREGWPMFWDFLNAPRERGSQNLGDFYNIFKRGRAKICGFFQMAL